MNNNISSLYSQSKNGTYTYNILDGLTVHVQVDHNPFGLPMEQLFEMAARVNPKRSFLFVSKVLGKHLAVRPYQSLLSGAALSLLLYREMQTETDPAVEQLLPEIIVALSSGENVDQAYQQLMKLKLTTPVPLAFIGFAETATALGHSMYEAFNRGATYVHTTRHQIVGQEPFIQFEEEHSHAVSHRCYAREARMIAGEHPIVLVDDEITTGKTALNIIRAIHEQHPRHVYYVASLLDWRSEENVRRYAELELELGITITPISLVKGQIEVEGKPDLSHPAAVPSGLTAETPVNRIELGHLFELLEDRHSVDGSGTLHTAPFIIGTGRFGVDEQDNLRNTHSIHQAATLLREQRQGTRTLCLGTEEFMYIPMRISAELGEGVFYHSTTRSPVYRSNVPNYPIRTGHSFDSPEDSSVTNYVYNLVPGAYDEVFVFLERQVPAGDLDSLIRSLQGGLFGQIHIVICGPEKGGTSL
ncbi:phosphoribosyltransferase family protein [Paenibacillus dauci]|uniref:phosphoribosyltransferase family protein n=1 Tax=Paenibacillus dauci TaxID=1567106 RepID=UPI00061949C4|nr:phosphoribosyltransferase family protein [Paenibacillus dauci]